MKLDVSQSNIKVRCIEPDLETGLEFGEEYKLMNITIVQPYNAFFDVITSTNLIEGMLPTRFEIIENS